MNSNEHGYIALISVLIVGAAALAIAVSLLITGTDTQRVTGGAQASMQARKLADACAEEALQKINETSSFTGNGDLNLGQGSCTYTVTNTGGSNRTITTSGTVNEAIRKVQVYVTITTSINVTSWQEVS